MYCVINLQGVFLFEKKKRNITTMSQCGFQEQLLSVVEVLAKAATEEINRRVVENCALIRIELSRSQRDIDHLKKKCLLMEGELRKVRGRARRKGTRTLAISRIRPCPGLRVFLIKWSELALY